MLNFERRVNFYLGETFIQHKSINIDKYNNIKTIKDLTENKNAFDISYDKHLKHLLIKTNNSTKKFVFVRGDIITKEVQNMVTLCKNRCDDNNNSVG